LKPGRITLFTTSDTYVPQIKEDCATMREMVAGLGTMARELRTEYDVALPINTKAKEALKKYFVDSYKLPQIFFGRDLIGDAKDFQVHVESGEVEELLAQFIDQDQTWTEIPWSNLDFGPKLGAGAQGTVRQARWNGSDCAVKVFRKEDVKDFTTEVELLVHVRHPNVVTFFGAVTKDAEHHAIVQVSPPGY
jgi:hypothetical protein